MKRTHYAFGTILAMMLILTSCTINTDSLENTEVDRIYTIFPESFDDYDISREPTLYDAFEGDGSVFLVCRILDKKVEKQAVGRANLEFLVMRVKVTGVAFANALLDGDEITLCLNMKNVSSDKALQIGDSVAMCAVKFEDSAWGYWGTTSQSAVYYITPDEKLIPMTDSRIYAPLAGLKVSDAASSALSVRNSVYQGVKFETSMNIGQRLGADNSSVRLSEIKVEDYLDVSLAELVDTDGEFRLPGTFWGESVSEYVSAPAMINLSGHETVISSTYSSNGTLIGIRIIVYITGEDSDVAIVRDEAAEEIQNARAALGFEASLTAQHSSAQVFVEDGALVIVLEGAPQ